MDAWQPIGLPHLGVIKRFAVVTLRRGFGERDQVGETSNADFRVDHAAGRCE
jgi:hypothetical protein